MIREVTITGYKALECVNVTLEPLTVIVGGNASGKSSFLDALAILANSSRNQRDVKTFVETLEHRSIRTHGSKRSLEMVALTDEGRLRLSIGDTRGWKNVFERLDGQTFDLTNTPASPTTEELGGIPPAVRLRLDTSALMRPALLRQGYRELAPDGEGLAAVLQAMQLAEDGRFRRVSDSLAQVVPNVLGVRTKQETLSVGSNSDVHAVVEVRTRGGGWCPASEASEGTLATLAILTAIHCQGSARLVLIDDLDRGLHPRAQSKLIPLIRAVMRDEPTLQIACTTHSPHLVNSFAPEEVRLFSVGASGHTAASRLVDHPDWPRWKDTFGSGEFWAAVGDEWVAEAAS